MSIFTSDDDDDEPLPAEDELLNLEAVYEDRTATIDEPRILEQDSGLSDNQPGPNLSAPREEKIEQIRYEKALASLNSERVKKTAKTELAELYGSDFVTSDAPESIDRYEKILALRSLERAAVTMGTMQSERRESMSEEPQTDQAISVIEQMKAYGAVAEPYLAHIVRAEVAVIPVREAAVEALGELREQEEPSHSLREALAALIRPGRGD